MSDSVSPPLISFTIPGKWRDRADFVERLAQTPGGYVVDGDVVRDTKTGRAYAIELHGHDPKLKDVFFIAGMGRMRKADTLAVGKHATSVRLVGFGGSVPAAVEMVRVATSVLAAGGIAVLVDSSGVSHNREDWMKLAGDREPGGIYWIYVVLIGGTAQRAGGPADNEFYSCGMHALGHRDVITDAIADPQQAWSVCHQFNGYVYQSGATINDGDPLANDFGPLYRARAEPCTHYPPGDLYHNPFGMWRIVRTGGENN